MNSLRFLYNNPFTGETEKHLYFSKTTCFPNSKNRKEKKIKSVCHFETTSKHFTLSNTASPLAKNKTVHYSNIFCCLQPKARSPPLSWSPRLHTVSQHFSTSLEIPQQSIRPVAGSGFSLSAHTRKHTGARRPHLSCRRDSSTRREAAKGPASPLLPSACPGSTLPTRSHQLSSSQNKLSFT